MDFQDIPLQEHLIKYMKKSIESGAIGHAYAFHGPPGLGKRTAALSFAKAILCKSPHSGPCHGCSSCIKVNHLNHPDLHIIEPEGNSIKNKQIEDFQHEVLLKPYESSRKVFIIKRANEMTGSAQNRLLKTLEEPPEYVVIILLCSNIHGLLPTIRSRCQILKFRLASEKELQQILMKDHGISTEDARVLAAYSHGNLGTALMLMKSENFKKDRHTIIQMIDQLLEGNSYIVFQEAEFFQNKKDKINEYLDIILFWFRDLLLVKETGSEEQLINLDKRNALLKHADNLGTQKISNIICAIEKTKMDIKANANIQLAIEVLLLRIQEV